MVLGALAVITVPVGVVASRYLGSVPLLHALYGSVPLSCLLAVSALVAARIARYRAARSVHGGGVRLARFMAWTGMYVGVTAALALAVYAALRAAQ